MVMKCRCCQSSQTSTSAIYIGTVSNHTRPHEGVTRAGADECARKHGETVSTILQSRNILFLVLVQEENEFSGRSHNMQDTKLIGIP